MEEQDLPVARVGDEIIRVSDFERSYVLALLQTGADDTPAARYDHLNGLIDHHLLYNAAVRNGLDAGPDLEGYTAVARKKALGGRYYEVAFLEQLPLPSDADVRLAFARFKQPILARHLFYRTEGEVRAAYARLQSGRPFDDEAKDCFEVAGDDSLAGYLGEVRYFMVDDAVAEAAFALEVGAYSEPVRSRQGWHIIRVEDRMEAPILTESEFQARKAGIAARLRHRRRRLEGDRFVHSFMEALDVQVNADGVQALKLALARVEESAPGSRATLQQLDRASAPVLSRETVLATYAQAGQTYSFTAADYALWLPELPFTEATGRTAASVGRALRNEALARAGELDRLDRDEVVQSDIEAGRRAFLAHQMQQLGPDMESLHRDATIEVDSARFERIMDL